MTRLRKDKILIRALILVIGLVGMSSLAYGSWSLQGFVLTDESVVSYEVELDEVGIINQIQADGVAGFTIFRMIEEAKEPVLLISDFSEAKGEQLPAGTYWVSPQLAPFVPEDKVLSEIGLIEDKEVKAFLKISILSLAEAEVEGIEIEEEE